MSADSFHLVWFRTEAAPPPDLSTVADCWRGIRDPEAFILMGSDSDALLALLPESIRANAQQRELRVLRRWGNPGTSEAQAANFVIRELQSDNPDDLLARIYEQNVGVSSQPGCLGCMLSQQVDSPLNLLGITYWTELAAFENYMRWAGEHPWKDFISPLTIAVPLRLLTQPYAP
jgi:hypothetical protein